MLPTTNPARYPQKASDEETKHVLGAKSRRPVLQEQVGLIATMAYGARVLDLQSHDGYEKDGM